MDLNNKENFEEGAIKIKSATSKLQKVLIIVKLIPVILVLLGILMTGALFLFYEEGDTIEINLDNSKIFEKYLLEEYEKCAKVNIDGDITIIIPEECKAKLTDKSINIEEYTGNFSVTFTAIDHNFSEVMNKKAEAVEKIMMLNEDKYIVFNQVEKENVNEVECLIDRTNPYSASGVIKLKEDGRSIYFEGITNESVDDLISGITKIINYSMELYNKD